MFQLKRTIWWVCYNCVYIQIHLYVSVKASIPPSHNTTCLIQIHLYVSVKAIAYGYKAFAPLIQIHLYVSVKDCSIYLDHGQQLYSNTSICFS